MSAKQIFYRIHIDMSREYIEISLCFRAKLPSKILRCVAIYNCEHLIKLNLSLSLLRLCPILAKIYISKQRNLQTCSRLHRLAHQLCHALPLILSNL